MRREEPIMLLPSPYCFGPFRLDPTTNCLWRDEQLLSLPPKPFGVLACLVVNAGEVVTKETLLEAVWPETVVTEGVLKTCIREVRQHLGESARDPLYITTIHGRGYRFIAPVSVTQTPPVDPPVAPSQPLLVERECELGQLQQAFDRAVQGQRQLLFVTEEVGIGKSALVDTWVAQTTGLEAARIGRGQCIDQYGAGEAYLPRVIAP